jgi:hypothetical protein
MKTNKLLLILLCVPLIGFGQWVQVGQDIIGQDDVNSAGASLTISINGNGNIIVVGEPHDDFDNQGLVRVFECINNTWTQIGQDILGEFPSDKFCITAINKNGDIIVTGALGNDGNGNNAGHVRVYEYINNNWIQLGQDIDGENSYDGAAIIHVNDNGNIIAIGAADNDGNGSDAGYVRIFEYNGTDWMQLGQDIDGVNPDDWCGHSLSLNSSGNIIGIASPMFDSISSNGNENSGHIRVFEYNGTDWSQIGNDIIGGYSVDLNNFGNRVIIGDPFNSDNGFYSGRTRVFEYNGTDWNQKGQDINGIDASDNYGGFVSISGGGDTIASSSYAHDSDKGHVRAFYFDGNVWNQIGQDIDGVNNNDRSGTSIAMNNSGSRIAIGAPNFDGNGIGSHTGHIRYSNLEHLH